ncbi:tyrosine-type recombinase/integrase [Rubrimonas cliftonensis]|uniref:Phage integrase family protein n=1 Tax=Rubrimonas cliftonensis TaxID=89524 RepID=A0A1H4CTF0_9RHOB|nr:tyrosine-type recombinase/integrase [Rubrimonas cliftonensis]SEA63611.1 Phage integrase family protein [Rubrimonas cliftonensis]
MSLFDAHGERLYLNRREREAFLVAAKSAPREIRSFCETLHYSGARISEVLGLTRRRVDLADRTLTFETLKKRRRGIYRIVPVPEPLTELLDLVHGLRERGAAQDDRLWSWSRTTAWRRVKAVLADAGVADGPHAAPKGFRHGYGVNAVVNGVPLNMLAKWMGHGSLEVTAIYANALGDEQREISDRMWR